MAGPTPRGPRTQNRAAGAKPKQQGGRDAGARGRSPSGRGEPAARAEQGSRDAHRASALEAGKALQRLLADAPGAHAVRPIAGGSMAGSVERALREAEQIEMHVPVIPPPVAWEVQARLDELARHFGRSEPRQKGDALQAGDEAELDVTGYVGGKPFLAATPSWYTVAPNPHLPQLFESLVGVKVGAQALVNITLAEDYPVAELRGRKAVFAIDVRAATRHVPLEVGSRAFLEKVGRGATLAEVKKSVEAELLEERAAAMVDSAKALFLRELYVRCEDDDVPAALVEEELYRRWRAARGDALIRQGIALEEQKASQQAFAADAGERFEARRTVWEMRVLEALAEQSGIRVDDEELLKVLLPPAQAAGLRRVDVEAMLRKNDAMRKGLLKNLKIDRAVAIVLGRGRIVFDGPAIPAPVGAAAKPPQQKAAPKRALAPQRR